MLLSRTNRVMVKNCNTNFQPTEVSTIDAKALTEAFKFDWSPIVYKGNTREHGAFLSCQALFADVDNKEGEPNCSINDFAKIFEGTHYILSTSKSHQKIKIGKNATEPKADRYHVLFPLDKPMVDEKEMQAYLSALSETYPFFDKAVKGATQFFFGNQATEVLVSQGNQINLESLESLKSIPLEKKARPQKETPSIDDGTMSEHDFLSSPANRVRLLNALKKSASEGAFDGYYDWVKVGMALKGAGYTALDFASISQEDALDAAIEKWDTFAPSSVSAGTLVYYAKQSTELHLYSPEELESIAMGAAIVADWDKNKQEERIKLLSTGSKEAKAGPAPDNIMPTCGLVRDIAQHIIDTSIRPLPLLAIASAVAFVGALVGRRYETPTGLGANIYFVGLAESGSGKDWARRCIKNIAHKADCNHLIGGETIASGAGLRSALEDHPVKLFLLDEFGLMLQSITGRAAGSYQKDIITTLMKLYSSYGTIFYGTEYSDKKMRARVDIESPCCIVYGTSTHQEFYNALSGGDATSGNIARMLVINESEARPSRQSCADRSVPDSIIKSVKDFMAYKNHEGNLSPYLPSVVPYRTIDVEKAFADLDDSMTIKMTAPDSRAIYSRVAENAIKLALVYAVSRDYMNPVIDEMAFAWGRDLSVWCANTLMEQFNQFVADSEHGKNVKIVLLQIKMTGAKGITGLDLLKKMQGLRAQERDEIITTLVDSAQIFLGHVETGGLVKRTQGRYFHADFYKEMQI